MNDPKPDPDRQENPVGPASSDSAGHGKNAEEHPTGSLNTMGNTARKVRAGTVTAIFNFALRRGPGPDGQPQIDPDAHDQTGIHHGPQAHSPARVREEGALDAVGAMNGADHPDSQNQVGQIRNKKRSFGVDGGEAIPARKRRRRSDNDESRQNRLRLVGLRQANRRQEGLRQAGRRHNGRHGGTSEVSRQSGSSGSAEVMGQERAAGESSNDYFATGRLRTKRGSRC
ncbi:hypothetical protein BKA63DRAFT_526880 [Paraphoma chrysanthemicola]|nr:hypothetical protein BKA63DRAFT_526880 [Paraphoma chrysanthemicola]